MSPCRSLPDSPGFTVCCVLYNPFCRSAKVDLCSPCTVVPFNAVGFRRKNRGSKNEEEINLLEGGTQHHWLELHEPGRLIQE